MKGFKWKYWIVPVVLLLGATALFRSGVLSTGKTQPQASDSVLHVATTQVEYTSKIPKHILSGSLEGQTSAMIGAKISGRIEQVFVQDGQRVKAGEPLVKLESGELANSAQMAQDGVRKAQANYDNVKADYNRYVTLYEQNAVSRQQLDSAETRMKVSDADLSSALAGQRNAEQQYGYGVITAPVDGVVANKAATVGQVVAPGAVLMTVENISQVYAVINIEQKDLGLVQLGQTAKVSVDAFPDKVFAGTVDIINSVAGASSRMFRTKVKVDNTEGLLKPGMYIKVELATGKTEQVVSVPQPAVIQKQGLYYVFVIENNKAIRQQVEVGDVVGNFIEIKSSLQQGQVIAVNNVNKLKDGDTVQVTK
jgi:membrane fusion protein, multidrug efflux system